VTDDFPSSFRFEPDQNVSTATRVETALELQKADSQVGWLQFNRLTYRFIRAMGGLQTPKIDASRVSINTKLDAARGLTVVTPKERSGAGALFLIHGGGHIVGNRKDIIALAADFAHQCGVPVICPSYRLSPQYPFPCDLDDLYTAWHWTMKNCGQMNIDAAKIVIGGQSAGGGLAAALAQRLYDEKGTQPVAQLLIYPMLDDRTALRRKLDTPRHRVWSNQSNLFGWTCYLGTNLKNSTLPYAVPARREDLTGLPPAWITVGTSDLFLDEDREYKSRLYGAGIDVSYLEIAGAIHGFDIANTEMGIAATRLHSKFIRRFTNT